MVSLPSYLGRTSDCSVAPGEALAVVGTVYGSALVGATSFGDGVDPSFITIYADPNGVVWNNPPGESLATLPTFWYGLMNSFMLYSALDLLDLDVRHKMLPAAAAAWVAATTAMGGDFGHTGFDFRTMKPIDNGHWTEGDAAGGVALLGVWAAGLRRQQEEKSKKKKALRLRVLLHAMAKQTDRWLFAPARHEQMH
jgi:hypothetical protein